jgi:hypothetical protein
MLVIRYIGKIGIGMSLVLRFCVIVKGSMSTHDLVRSSALCTRIRDVAQNDVQLLLVRTATCDRCHVQDRTNFRVFDIKKHVFLF